MHENKAGTNLYQLGLVAFSLADLEPNHELDCLFPKHHSPYDHLVEFPANERNVRSIINQVLSYHSECLWFDAACLLSPEGKRILISGGSGSGKSTTSMALVFGHGWKVYSEDVTLIDPVKKVILNFASPFSLKTGTKELLEEALGAVPGPICLDEWLPPDKNAIAETCPVNFDIAMLFENARASGPLQCAQISPNDYVRRLLPISNLIHKEKAPETITDYIGKTRCFHLTGGTLAERMHTIRAFCKSN
jgi:hypothetical protein